MKENIEGLTLSERLEQIEHLLEKDKYQEAWLGLKEVETQGGLNTTSLNMGVFYYLSAVALYDLGRYDESLESGKKSFELFKNTLENKRIAQVQFTLGNDYLALGKLKQAENEFRDSIATCRRIDEEKGIIQAYNKLAQICFIRSDYVHAIEFLKECIPYLEKIKDWVNLGVFQRNLGRIYTLSGELDLAEKHLLSNIKETKKAGQEINLSRCLLSLGYLRLLKREFKKASSYFLRAFQLLSRNESLRDLAIYYEYQGELYFQQKRLEEAESCYLKAIEIGEKIAPEGGIISQSYRLLAELDLKRKDLEKASEDVEKSLKVSKALGEKLEEGLAYKISGEIYSLKNEKDKSREAFEKGVNLLEEINAKYEQIKIYISLSYSQGFDYPEKQNYLGKAKKLSSELGLRYFEGLSELARARIEFEFDNFENLKKRRIFPFAVICGMK
jgi:tetratricopeptide (TPR) repeat protein